MRSKQHGKRLRQEGAIKRLETTADKVESIRSKKIERVRTTIENTKENIK